MTEAQRVIKYVAMVIAIFLIIAIIGGALSCLSFITVVFTPNESVSVSQLSEYSIDGIDRLYIDLEAADLEIVGGAEFSIKSNHEYLDIEESSHSLSIKEIKRPWKANDKGYKVVITVPENISFENVTISTGAGRLTLDALSTKAMKLSLGAGEVNLNNVTTTDKTELEGGAGEITITDCSFTDLDMQIGVAECNLTAIVLGDSDIDCGVGEVDFNFIRTSDCDYTLSVDKGLGEVKVDDKAVKDGATIGFGENEIDIHCGVGEVDIEFIDR